MDSGWDGAAPDGLYDPSFRTPGFDGRCFEYGFDDVTLDLLEIAMPAHRQKLKDAHAKHFGAVSGTVCLLVLALICVIINRHKINNE